MNIDMETGRLELSSGPGKLQIGKYTPKFLILLTGTVLHSHKEKQVFTGSMWHGSNLTTLLSEGFNIAYPSDRSYLTRESNK